MTYSLGVSTLDKQVACKDFPEHLVAALADQLDIGAEAFPALPMKRKPGRPRKEQVVANNGLLRAEDVVEELRSQELKGIREFLKIGTLLNEKKAAVGHGEFLRLFKDHPSPVASPLKMSSKRAQEHMKVARDPRIRQHFHRLPSAFDTLLVLSRLSTEFFETGLEDGSIHEDLTRHKAEQLVKKATGGTTATAPPARAASTAPQGHRQTIAIKRVQLALWPLIDSFDSTNDRQLLKSAVSSFIKSLE